jgi:hypothetical protein
MTTLNGTECPAAHPAWTSFVPSFSGFCEGERDEIEACAREHRDHSRTHRDDLEDLSFSRAEAYRAALIGRPV